MAEEDKKSVKVVPLDFINMSEENHWIYLASFMDGEGSIGVSREFDKRKSIDYFVYRPMVQVVNTDEGVIEWIMRFTKAGKIAMPKRRENHQQIYHWMVRKHEDAHRILTGIAPYLRIKYLQAFNVLDFLNVIENTPSKRGWYKPYSPKIKHIYNELKTLNLRGKEAHDRSIAY